ncbi:MAG: diguanylate cyclase [bacterium]|nr:diguanylate cyclase [bacterium]
MIDPEDAKGLRDDLLAVLSEDAHNTQRLLARMDAITRESGVGAHAALLLILTHLAFEEHEARRHWEAVLAHRDELSKRVGRDIGVRVAVLDYFMNINRQLVQPALIDIEMLESTARDATRDKLTGLINDVVFHSSLQHELRRARRYSQKTALVLLDIDDFEKVNEQVGVLVGDRLLKEASILCSNNIRDIDIAARPGSDEFALLLPETDRNGAILVAERVRREFESFFAGRESAGRTIELTVSIGVACYPEDASTPERLLEGAAQALYQAKASGRNCVQMFHPERRRFLRFELEPGLFEVEVVEGMETTSASPRNLSRNGILFASPEALQLGEKIEIRLARAAVGDADARSLRVRGQVVRVEELPRPLAVGAESDPIGAGALAEDRFEIGMAFDLDWTGGTDDLLDFLEKARSRAVGPAP